MDENQKKHLYEIMQIQLRTYRTSNAESKDYMQGLYNGMELAKAIIENKPAILLDRDGNLG